MEAIVQWLSQYGGWGALMILGGLVFWMVLNGKLETSARIERDRETWRGLAATVERLADAQEEGGRALRDLQTSVRNLEEGQRTELHALESFQRAREDQR